MLALYIDQQAGHVDAGVIDDCVDGAVFRDDRVCHSLDTCGICYVTCYAVSSVDLISGLDAHINDDRVGAGCLEAADYVFADTGRAACDDNNFAFKI